MGLAEASPDTKWFYCGIDACKVVIRCDMIRYQMPQ